MPSQEILQLGNPLLWERSIAVDNIRSPENRALIQDLSETLAAFRQASGFGRGIAAPQIGALRRLVFIRMQPAGFTGPLINPEIIWASNDRIELWDDCFSLPNLMVRVSRAASVRVSYQDDSGVARAITADGDLSELLQHEIDHLDGILAVQRAVSPTAFSTRSEWERKLRSESAVP